MHHICIEKLVIIRAICAFAFASLTLFLIIALIFNLRNLFLTSALLVCLVKLVQAESSTRLDQATCLQL